MRTADGGTVDTSDSAYRSPSTSRTFRVNPDDSTTPIVIVSATSVKYGVRFTWTMLAATVDADGAPPLIALKTEQVNQICGHDHVQDFRTESDQGPSNQLYHFAVITVGDDAQELTNEVRQRMDQLGDPSVFGKIDTAWRQLQAIAAGP